MKQNSLEISQFSYLVEQQDEIDSKGQRQGNQLEIVEVSRKHTLEKTRTIYFSH